MRSRLKLLRAVRCEIGEDLRSEFARGVTAPVARLLDTPPPSPREILSWKEVASCGACCLLETRESVLRRSFSRKRISYFFSIFCRLSYRSLRCERRWSFSRFHFARSFSCSKISVERFFSASRNFSSISATLVFALSRASSRIFCPSKARD